MYKDKKRVREQECKWNWEKRNWTRLIFVIRQPLNMHRWDLIREAANAQSHRGSNCKCVLMYAPYYVSAIQTASAVSNATVCRLHVSTRS